MNRSNRIAALASIAFLSILVSGCATTLTNKGAYVCVTSQSEEIKNCK